MALAGAAAVGTTFGALLVATAPAAASGSNTVFLAGQHSGVGGGIAAPGQSNTAFVAGGAIGGSTGIVWNTEFRTGTGTRGRGGETGTL
ncbi:hypothetical protein [Krasilnikovia sp. M28-CT-15]|uniref:hypothetical protein n=1 Tax=Krasilnikovia sp. M28-CT-15 TaxID=3373540 RepID=UPI00399C9963